MRWHGIAAPIQGVDFSYDMGPVELPPPGTKFFVTPPQLPKKPAKNYRCSCCSSNSSRTFVLGGVKEHIKHKHKIGSPLEGTHFYKIK